MRMRVRPVACAASRSCRTSGCQGGRQGGEEATAPREVPSLAL